MKTEHEQVTGAQEPVAWMVYTLDGLSVYVTDNPADFTAEHRALPLYTGPFPTDEALRERMEKALKDIRSLSSINSATNPNSFALTVLLADIHHIADTALAKGNRND
jgi:hypothetical protein